MFYLEIKDLKLVKVSDRIYYLPHLEEFDWCTLGLVIGDEHVLMMDSGASDRHVAQFFAQLDENNLPRPDTVALTHWHWDHTYGLAHIKNTVSFANKDTNRQIEKMQTWEWTDEAMKRRLESGEDLAFSYPHINGEYPDKSRIKIAKATVEYDDKLLLDLGGVHVRMQKIENSHSYDCSVFYIEEEKTIFLGDIRYEDLLPLKPVYYADSHEKLITGLRKYDFDKVISGHQPLMSADELYAQLAAVQTTER